MSQTHEQRSATSATAAAKKVGSFSDTAAQKAAARAALASTKIEGRDVPPGYVRPDGVKALIAEREARKP